MFRRFLLSTICILFFQSVAMVGGAAAQNGVRAEQMIYGNAAGGRIDMPHSAAQDDDWDDPPPRNNAEPAPSAPKGFSIPPFADLEPMSYVGTRYRMRTGARLGTIDCAYTDIDYVLKAGNSVTDEFQTVFFDEMTNAGYDLVGDPSSFFGKPRETARYLVAGQVHRVDLDMECDYSTFIVKYVNADRIKGKGRMSVTWQVYDDLEQQVVYETTTNGTSEIKNYQNGGEVLLQQMAFADAAADLARNRQFFAVFDKGAPNAPQTQTASLQPPAAPAGAAIMIDPAAPYRDPITVNMQAVRNATVTIEFGSKHGSGFLITRSGLILTNHHVVGSSDQVKVRFLDGTEAYGTVVRRDQLRDVALVQIPPTGRMPIPIRTDPALVGEEVYAIGAPQNRDLSGTVSRGIVSSMRIRKEDGLAYIQSDVSIHGGNSGGPLVDGQGNVMGISVAGLFMDETQRSAGLNLFIPIDDAFRKLSLRLAGVNNWPGY